MLEPQNARQESRKSCAVGACTTVTLVPQMFVVNAMDKGCSVTLIVDSDSLQSLAIGADNKGACSPSD
jgi:hypothetical protein